MSDPWADLYPSYNSEARRKSLQQREDRLVRMNRRTPLIQAILDDDENAVLLLLRKGADPRERTRCGADPMHMAMMRGHPGIVRALALCGANCKVGVSAGMTLLHFAARWGDVELVQIAVERGKICINEPTSCKETALDFAMQWASAGAEVVQANFPNRRHGDSEKNYADTIRWLIQNGALPSTTHKDRMNWPRVPVDVVKLMVSIGYDMDRSGSSGMCTLVTEALEQHSLDIVEYALASGARANSSHQLAYIVAASQRFPTGYKALLLLAAYNVEKDITPPDIYAVHRSIAQSLRSQFLPENVTKVHALSLLVTLGLMPPSIALDERMLEHYPKIGARLIERKRLELFLNQSTDICIALQPLGLSAHETIAILDHAVLLAQLVPVGKKWALVTLVKHFLGPLKVTLKE